jgi:aryl-alcohol dehydrogenase-like predicted oxidoreductase
MEYRQLGGSDVKVSAITFGAWAIGGFMWGGADEEAAIAAIKASLDAGINTIDTAPVYGLGRSEELVAAAIKGRRDKVVLLTKFGLRWDEPTGTFHFEMPDTKGRPIRVYKHAAAGQVIAECEASLRRLGTDYIDLFQQHWPDEATPVEETMRAVERLLKDGKIRAAGVSNYSVEQMERARQVVPLASDQPPFSMVNRGIERELVPYCRQHNIGLIVYSPLQRGLLTGKMRPDQKFAPGDHRAQNAFFKPEMIQRVNALLESIRYIADGHRATLAQVAIAWTIARPGITAALVGARDARQAAENARAADIRLTADEMATIDSRMEEMKL